MAAISYDGQSFIVDGRRVWLVSGSIPYARIPRGLWKDRLHAAKECGLNCIETPVFWDLHEPRPGVFHFDGEADLKHFVKLIAEAGMWCILRIGPYVGDGWGMGGLPAWLLAKPGRSDTPARLRQGDPLFLQAVSRYLDALLEQVKPLQATEPGGGPIIAVQSEHQWLCHHEKQAGQYLEEVNRFLRESGCAVPVLTRNNLWQQVKGTMETWQGESHDLATARQLRVVQSEAPVMIHVPTDTPPQTWSNPRPEPPRPDALLRRLAEVSAAGAMFDISPFCGGTTPGFHAGRLENGDRLAPTHAPHAPISPTGAITESYRLIKPLALFLSHFGDVMAHLRGREQHTIAAAGLSVIQQTGTRGTVVFLLRDADAPEDIELTLPDGQSLSVPMRQTPVAWLLLNANLGGGAMLDACNLRPCALLNRKLLLFFGPAGSEAVISINGKLHTATVPTGKTPVVLPHDDLSLVILNPEQVDAARIENHGLLIGDTIQVTHEGRIKQLRPAAPLPRNIAPKLGPWQCAETREMTGGSSPHYATISGPQSLETCGTPAGYGWYMLTLDRRRPTRLNLMPGGAESRLHLYVNGKPHALLGPGPDAAPPTNPVPLTLPSGRSSLVFLADAFGRYAEGLGVEQPRGLHDHLYDVKPLALGKPKITEETRADPFVLGGYVPRCDTETRGTFPRWAFDLSLRGPTQIILALRGPRPRSLILVNNQLQALDPGHATGFTHTLKHLHAGKNRLTLAAIDPPEKPFDPRKHLSLYQVIENISEKAAWHFAQWQLPQADRFTPLKSARVAKSPAFFRTVFTVHHPRAPLLLELAGGTKGQIHLNGHNLGGYFTTAGQKNGPREIPLPEPWLNTDRENELVFFDEHGLPPTNSRLVYTSRG